MLPGDCRQIMFSVLIRPAEKTNGERGRGAINVILCGIHCCVCARARGPVCCSMHKRVPLLIGAFTCKAELKTAPEHGGIRQRAREHFLSLKGDDINLLK